LRLRPDDEALIAAVVAANPRTVVAVVAGSAVLVEPWIDSVPAVVQSWYAGMEGGHALADILLGRAEPSGRLPFTVPTDEAHLPEFDRDADAVVYDGWHGWWLLERDGKAPRFPFGFGLSYTCFALGPATVEVEDDALVVRTAVRNVGRRDGTDVVQLYGGRDGARRRLIGFAAVTVAAGADVAVTMRVPKERLAVRDTAAHQWVVEPGTYRLMVARHAADPAAVVLDAAVS
jgi:beta-glucosidase